MDIITHFIAFFNTDKKFFIRTAATLLLCGCRKRGKALQEAMSKVENRVQEHWDEAVAQGIRAENNNTSNVELKTRYSERDDILNHFGIPERKLSDYVFVQRNVYRTLDSNGFFNKSEKIIPKE